MIQIKALKASFNTPEKLIWCGIYRTSSNIYDGIFAKKKYFRQKNSIIHVGQGLEYASDFTTNPLQPGFAFLYYLKTSENLQVFWCFQEV